MNNLGLTLEQEIRRRSHPSTIHDEIVWNSLSDAQRESIARLIGDIEIDFGTNEFENLLNKEWDEGFGEGRLDMKAELEIKWNEMSLWERIKLAWSGDLP